MVTRKLPPERALLAQFAESADGLEARDRIKIILFAAGLKPATFAALKIHPKNLDEREHFERHLRASRVPFRADRPKSYEQIAGVKGNAIRWEMAGTWYGYDLFQSAKDERLFDRYVGLFHARRHGQADPLGAKLYGYPACCARQYQREHDLAYLRKRYSYGQFYHKLGQTDRKFPFIQHTPCSASCAATRRLNAAYAAAIRAHAPRFWKQFTAVRKFRAELIVDEESDIFEGGPLFGGTSIWPRKDGHEYSLVSRKPLAGHHYLFSHLTRRRYDRGTVLDCEVTMRHDHADIKVRRETGHIEGLHHERRYGLVR
jgi:hypothetical protein